MKPSDEMVEAAALTLYNRVIGRWGMRPVDYIGANQTKTAAEIRDDVRAVLTVAYPAITWKQRAEDAEARVKALEEALDSIWEHAFSLESIIREGVYQSKECGSVDAWVNADEGNYNGVWASYREEYQQARAALKGG